MPKRSSPKRRRSSSSSDSEAQRKRQKKHKEKEREKDKEKERVRNRAKDKEKDKEKDREKDKGRDRGRRRRTASDGSRTRSCSHRSRSRRSRSRRRSGSGRSRSRRSKRSSSERETLAARKVSEKSPTNEPAAGAKRPGLGDLAELQRQLDEERSKLQLFVLKAKQEHDEKQETTERRERREREYYKASWGEPCGPENRFLLEGEIGKGAFSTVFRCRDTAGQGKEYAIKFIRLNAMLRKATEKEVKLMRRLRTKGSEEDPEGARCFLGLAGPETFEHQGHLAVVFQLQRCDLRSGLHRYGQGNGLPLPTVQCYAGNIFMALRALRKVNVIHSDVKPDNLLMTLDKTAVKLSDFGSAMGVTERIKTDYVQPRWYRAPEVILGQAYGTEIDTWSAGLTLFELASGRIVFQGKDNNDMLHEVLKVNGQFPKQFAISGDFAARHFTKDGDFKCHEPSLGGPEVTVPMVAFPKTAQAPQPFQQLLEEHIKEAPPGSDEGRHQARLRGLADLLAHCVATVPAERLTPETALQHRFFQSGTK